MITETLVATIADKLQGVMLDSGITRTLRGEFPDVHFTYCMDDDVHGPTPVYESGVFNLYLITTQEHCLAVTSQYGNATGVVVAEVSEEE